MAFFTTPDGCRIFYQIHGSTPQNPYLVFLNGTMQTALQWVPHARELKQHCNVLIYDARSQGKSDLSSARLGIDVHTTDLLGLMRRLEIKAANLVGLSHGAMIAMAMAGQYPDVVKRLVLCSIGGIQTTRLKTIIKSWCILLRHGSKEAFAWSAVPWVFGEAYLNRHWHVLDKWVHAIATRNHRDALITHMEAMLDYPFIGSLADKVQSPSLLITGTDDALIPLESARQLAERLKAVHHELPGIGHTIPVEAPARLLSLIQSFMHLRQH